MCNLLISDHVGGGISSLIGSQGHKGHDSHAQGVDYLGAEELLGLPVVLHVGLGARPQQHRVQHRAEGEQTGEEEDVLKHLPLHWNITSHHTQHASLFTSFLFTFPCKLASRQYIQLGMVEEDPFQTRWKKHIYRSPEELSNYKNVISQADVCTNIFFYQRY